MKNYIAPIATLLVAVSIGRAAADDESSPVGKVLATLMTVTDNSLEKPASLSDMNWSSMIACTADIDGDNPSLIDETNCATAKDSDGAACVWCDASSIVGQGVCVSTSQKDMLGSFWDALCAVDDGSGTVPDAAPTPPDVPVTPSPTPPPTNPPVPDPTPDNDNDNVPDQLKCAMDGQDVVADKASCEAKKDTTSATDENCKWCKIPLLGGSCLSNSMQQSVSWMCRSSSESFVEKEKESSGYLRGDNTDSGGFKELDPSCLGAKSECGTKTDSNGGACMWCDAGGVFGICATSAQEGYLAPHLNCALPATAADGKQSPEAIE